MEAKRKGSTWVNKEDIPEEEESDSETPSSDNKVKKKDSKDSKVSDNKVPQTSKISKVTTTILVTDEKKDVKLKEDDSKSKEACQNSSKSKEESGNKTQTRQRRQGRLELNLESSKSQFLTVDTNHQPLPSNIVDEKKSEESEPVVTLKVTPIESKIKFSEDNQSLKTSDCKER